MVGCYGGEEFGIIFFEIDVEGVWIICEWICEIIE